MQVRLIPEAENEVLDAAKWYSQQSYGLDYEFIRCIDEAVAKIGKAPLMYPVYFISGAIQNTGNEEIYDVVPYRFYPFRPQRVLHLSLSL